jgi:hypothetical protein
MDDRDELEEALELLRYTFEELKELRNWSLHEFLGARSGEPAEAWEGRDVRAWCEGRGLDADFDLERALRELLAELDHARWAGDDAPIDRARVADVAARWTKEGL